MEQPASASASAGGAPQSPVDPLMNLPIAEPTTERDNHVARIAELEQQIASMDANLKKLEVRLRGGGGSNLIKPTMLDK